MSKTMKCSTLGDNLRTSQICLGTASFGSSISKDDSFLLMDTFIDAGGNFLDTAHIYADWKCEIKGMSERTIGEWMSSRKNRDKVVVATKGGHADMPSIIPRLAPEQINKDLKESLQRLQIEQVDLYWLHRDDPKIPVSQILDTLESLRKEGFIRNYAASNWTVSRLREADAYAKKKQIPGMAASQIEWSLVKTTPEGMIDPTMVIMNEEIYKYHLQTKMPVVPYTSQASGFFGGKYSREHPETGYPEIRKKYDTESNWQRLERAIKLADELKCNANQIALAYLIAQPFPVFPIVGSQNVGQLLDSCGAVEIHLTAEQVRYLEVGE